MAEELRDIIRAAIVEWDRSSPKGQRSGEFLYILSERERDELAEAIERALHRVMFYGRP